MPLAVTFRALTPAADDEEVGTLTWDPGAGAVSADPADDPFLADAADSLNAEPHPDAALRALPLLYKSAYLRAELAGGGGPDADGPDANAAANQPRVPPGSPHGGRFASTHAGAPGAAGLFSASGHNVHTPAGLAAYIAAHAPPGLFTPLHLRKIAHLNPGGVAGGEMLTPDVATPAANKAQQAFLLSHLPPGTVVKWADVKAKHLQPGAAAPPLKTKVVGTAGPAAPAPPAAAPTATTATTAPPAPPPASAATPAGPPKPLPSARRPVGTHDRDATVAAVHDALAAAGVSPSARPAYHDTQKVLSRLQTSGVTDGTLTHLDVERALKNLYGMAAATTLPPLFDHLGTRRRPNPLVPDAAARPKLAPAEAAAAQRYTTQAYGDLNAALRSTGAPPPAAPYCDYPGLHAGLRAAFGKAGVMRSPVACVRGMKLSAAESARFEADLRAAAGSGGDWSNAGYMSVTPGGSAMSHFRGNVELRVNAVHGLDLGPHTHHPHGSELLLNHGSRFRVTGVTRRADGTLVADLDQLPPAPGSPAAGAAPARKPRAVRSRAPAGALQRPPALPPVPQKDYPADPVDALLRSQAFTQHMARPAAARDALHAGIAGGKEDKFLTALVADAGRAAPPEALLPKAGVLALEAAGWKIGYRGLRDVPGGPTGAAMQAQFRTGSLYSGAGVYGNGTYVAVAGAARSWGGAVTHADARAEAATYARGGYGRTAKKGAVSRYAIPPTARVVKHAALKAERDAEYPRLDAALAAGRITRDEHLEMKRVIADEGRYAVLKNYDVIDASSGTTGYHVLLNRSIVRAQKDDS